jgi:hypothetical protein
MACEADHAVAAVEQIRSLDRVVADLPDRRGADEKVPGDDAALGT